MILSLRSVLEDGAAEERTLEHGTMTLGRGGENDWVLADPERTLSKTHCRIDRSEDGFVITDQSTNGVFVNGDSQPIGRGRSRKLLDGDVVTVGPINLEVSIAAARQPAEPYGAFEPTETTADIVPLLRPAAPTISQFARPHPGGGSFTGIQHAPDSPIIPPAGEPWLEQIPGGDFGPDRHVRPQGWETPLDPADYAASGTKAAPDPLDQQAAEFSQGSEHLPATATVVRLPTAQSVLPTDWNDTDPMAGAMLAPSPIDALFGAIPDQAPATLASEPGPPAATIQPDVAWDSSESPVPASIPSSFVPTFVPAPGPVAAPVLETSPVPPPASAEPGRSGLLQAFLEGAELSSEAVEGMSETEIGLNLGRMLRVAIDGVRDILATRAMVKSELRADQTIIQAGNNSALKFAPDVRRCLAAMVGVPPQGFVPGAVAMQGALDDIKRHELALVAALNSVFASINDKLDPENIAAAVRAASGIASMVPLARDARCWAVYQENYEVLRSTDAENTGGSLLAPLAVAYARQLGRPIHAPAKTTSPNLASG